MSRDAILGRVRSALGERTEVAHPGPFEAWGTEVVDDPVEVFTRMFEAAGGEVVRIGSIEDARRWLSEFCTGFESIAVGETVPAMLCPEVATALAHEAALGVSMATGAVAETGSLILDARDGRGTQLLPPTHLVWVYASSVEKSMAGAFAVLRHDLPSALGLHSGPSKSADIGQILVTGVHGPGRVIAAILVEGPS